ncbi:MAG TPA: thiamine phosphate synthase, partial [Labilithrix sp.]
EDVIAAAREGASAVYVSPIFATPGKGAPRGLDAIRRARELAGDMLVYALGGVDASNAAACITAGADGVALIRAFFDADSPRDSLLAVRRAALEGGG